MSPSGKKRNYSDLSSDESESFDAVEVKEETDSEEEKQKSPKILTEKEWKNLDKNEVIDDYFSWEMKDDEEKDGEEKEKKKKKKKKKNNKEDEEEDEEEEDSEDKDSQDKDVGINSCK